jgi:hypothetical protein
MNKFLQSLEITFRRDPTNFRPRVNKLNSVKDKEQKGLCPVDVCDRPLIAFFVVVQFQEITSSLRSECLGRRREMYDVLYTPHGEPGCQRLVLVVWTHLVFRVVLAVKDRERLV